MSESETLVVWCLVQGDFLPFLVDASPTIRIDNLKKNNHRKAQARTQSRRCDPVEGVLSPVNLSNMTGDATSAYK